MTPEIDYLIVCDTVIQDKDTDKASAIGIFNELTVDGNFPVGGIQIPVSVVARIKNALGASRAVMNILNPDKTLLVSLALGGENDEPNLKQNLNLIGRFSTIQFTSKGTYQIEIIIDDRKIDEGRYSIVIN